MYEKQNSDRDYTDSDLGRLIKNCMSLNNNTVNILYCYLYETCFIHSK